jgi:hypothetical protein
MIMRYEYLRHYPQVFLKVTGLQVAEFDALIDDVLPQFTQAERQRLYQFVVKVNYNRSRGTTQER